MKICGTKARLNFAVVAFTAALCTSLDAKPVTTPTFTPDGGSAEAPAKVTIRCETSGATIHVTVDGNDPTPTDEEIDSGSSVVIDEPLTLKARAWLRDGSA